LKNARLRRANATVTPKSTASPTSMLIASAPTGAPSRVRIDLGSDACEPAAVEERDSVRLASGRGAEQGEGLGELVGVEGVLRLGRCFRLPQAHQRGLARRRRQDEQTPIPRPIAQARQRLLLEAVDCLVDWDADAVDLKLCDACEHGHLPA